MQQRGALFVRVLTQHPKQPSPQQPSTSPLPSFPLLYNTDITVLVFFAIMRGEILHLMIGQAGVQLGNSAWELYETP
jgi:hypothetical protein